MEETAIGVQGFKFLVSVVVAIILLQTAVSAFGAGSTYSPGVAAGQWTKYGQISANWYSSNSTIYPVPPQISDFQSVNSTTLTVQRVQGSYINASRVRSYANGTTLIDTILGDVQTGEGNIASWIVAGNLTAGNETYPGSGQTFSSTVSRMYLGVSRRVNVLSINQSYPFTGGTAERKINEFWDQISGVLLELHFAFGVVNGTRPLAYGSADAVVVASNIFSEGPQPDFFLYVSPVPIVVAPGANASALVFGVSINNFSDTIVLSASFLGSSLISASVNPSSIQVSPTGSNNSTLMVMVGASVLAGIYNVNLTGTTSGNLHHSISVPVEIVGPGTYLPGVKAGDMVNYKVNTYWFTNLAAVPKPGLFNNYGNITAVRLTVLGVIGMTVTANLTWTFTNSTGSRIEILSGDVNSGLGTLDLWVIAGGLKTGDAIFNSPAASHINSTLTKMYAGSLHNVNLLNITLTIPVTSQGITVPTNIQLVWFWDQTTGVLLERYESINVTFGSIIAQGNIDILATQTNITPPTPGFKLSADPSQASFLSGSSLSSTVKATSLNGFSGSVTFSVNNVFCAAISCPHASLTPATLSLPSGGTATSTLTFTATTSGTYNIVVNATGAGVMQSVNIEFTVNPPPPPDFSLTATSSLSIQAGKSDIATLNISPGTGFTSQVSLTVTAPDGVTVTLARNSITGSGTVGLTVTIANNLPPGIYAVTVKATGGSQTHTKTITVMVTAPPSPPSAASNLILGLDPTLFYSIVAAIAVVAITAGVLAFRARKPHGTLTQAPAVNATVSTQ